MRNTKVIGQAPHPWVHRLAYLVSNERVSIQPFLEVFNAQTIRVVTHELLGEFDEVVSHLKIELSGSETGETLSLLLSIREKSVCGLLLVHRVV